VNLLITLRFFLILVSAGALTYFIFRIWRRKNRLQTEETGVDFRPTIGFTPLDGCRSLAVLLLNKSDSNVWAEEIEVMLSDLRAYDQTSEASCREVLKIHQTIRPPDMLPVSLVETIYKAAGGPQRRYSCVMSSIVRYRAGEEWFEKAMQPHKLNMAGLTLVSCQRQRWNNAELKTQDESEDSKLVGAKSK
jgi:hypothetical protein